MTCTHIGGDTNPLFHYMAESNSGRNRGAIRPGLCVDIIQKQDQRTGKKTRGLVHEILTGSSFHPHGIKVRLRDGRVGRVCAVIAEQTPGPDTHESRI